MARWRSVVESTILLISYLQTFLISATISCSNEKERSALCTQCMSHGIHDYGMYKPNDLWDQVSTGKQINSGQRFITTMFSSPHIHVRNESRVEKLRKSVTKIINAKAR